MINTTTCEQTCRNYACHASHCPDKAKGEVNSLATAIAPNYTRRAYVIRELALASDLLAGFVVARCPKDAEASVSAALDTELITECIEYGQVDELWNNIVYTIIGEGTMGWECREYDALHYENWDALDLFEERAADMGRYWWANKGEKS